MWKCHACNVVGGLLDFERALTGKPDAECWAAIYATIGRPEREVQRGADRIVETYPYHDASGKVRYEVVRMDPKNFCQRRPDGKDGWIWDMAGVIRIPYNLPVLVTANVALIAEGEKDALNLQRASVDFPAKDGTLRYAATCNVGGAGKWLDEYSPYLTAKRVFVFVDNDDPGRKHTLHVCTSIHKYAQAVHLVELSGLAPKGDVSDYLAEHTPQELFKVMRSTPAWTPPAKAVSTVDDWPEPESLGTELPPVPAFDAELLPDALRPWCIDISERMQVPLDFPAVAAVATMGASVMRRALIQPKALDSTWIEYPNVWGALVADPGLMKSPVINAAMVPLRQIESLWRMEYASELSEYHSNKLLAELKTRAWEQQFVAAAKKGDELPIQPDDSIREPRQRRILTADATFESLHQIMADNPAGIACWRDELAGWLAGLERQGRESERQFYLEGWSGHWGCTIDRIGRGSIHVENVCLSVFGGIQPNRMRSYLADVLSGGPTDDGLIQRFGLLVWPDFDGRWRYIDVLPHTAAQQRAADVYAQLIKLEAENPLRLKFDANAQQMFIAWLTALETKIRSVDTPSVLRGHFAKYRKLMPALSLLFALADGHMDAVPLESAKRAAGWCEYLEPHACRVYASKLAPEIAAAQTLSRRLSAGWRAADGSLSLRDVYRPQWTGLNSPDEARAALYVLCEYGWVRKEQVATDGPGRPSEIYLINPRIAEMK